MCVPREVNVQRRHEHRLRIQLKELQEFTVAVDCAVKRPFDGGTADPQLLLHFVNERSLSLNSVDELRDGRVLADGVAAAFEEHDLQFI